MTNEKKLSEMNFDRVLELRGKLEDAIPPLAYSTGGGRFDYHAPLGATYLPPGCYVTFQVGESQYIGQIISQKIVTRNLELSLTPSDLGSTNIPDGEEIRLGAQIRIRGLEGDGVLLGRVADGRCEAVPDDLVFRDASFDQASSEDVHHYMLTARSRESVLEVGTVLNAGEGVPAFLDPTGFSRHTFLCGQSGSGKTYSLGVILERLLMETSLPIVILDPNSDFVRLGDLRETPKSPMVDRYRIAAQGVHVLRARGSESTNVLNLRFSDLEPSAQAAALMIDPLTDREEFDELMRAVEQLGHRQYSLLEVYEILEQDDAVGAKKLHLRIRNLRITQWDVWARTDESASITDAVAENRRCLVVDIGGLARPAEKLSVANSVLANLWENRYRRQPVMIVIDEAHNVCPRSPSSSLAALTNDLVTLIAGEGRKFGLYLLLASQRPDKINPNVLSQCENLVLMRMNSESDLEHVQSVFSHVPRSLLAQASRFRLGQALVAGRIVQHATLLKFTTRLSEEGGSDVPTSWLTRPNS